MMKDCSPWAASVTAPAGKVMTMFPSPSRVNSVNGPMETYWVRA